MSPKLRLWCALPSTATPRSQSDILAEAHPLHNAERRLPIRPSDAYNTIRHAQQIETAKEIDVSVLGSLPQARCPRKTQTGVDIGLVRIYSKQYAY